MEASRIAESSGVVEAYAEIGEIGWRLVVGAEPVVVEGGVEDPDPLRHQLKSMLEILCYLRRHSGEAYRIYTNSTYCINCCEKWIPKWLERGFRVGNTETLRPHTDLLVQLYAFRRCVTFELVQHYDAYTAYGQAFSHDLPEHEEEEEEENEENEEQEEEEHEEGILA
jgi:ribonuclease HI